MALRLLTKRELAILERAYSAEINSALSGALPIIQSRSRVAEQLAADGYLQKRTIELGGRLPVTVEGYELTHAGRFAYCATC